MTYFPDMNDAIERFKVPDRQSFSQLLKMLHDDFTNNPDSWENITLGDFLEAMSGYSADIQGFYDNTNQNIDANVASWRVFADIIIGATVYE